MPISNSWLNQGVSAILEGIEGLELNASVGGSRRYRYVTSARIKIPKETWVTIIPGTAKPVSREIFICLISGTAVSLEWQGMAKGDYLLLQLNSRTPEYRDDADGGVKLKGLGNIDDCEIAVIIRQEEPIAYKLGGNEVANVNVGLWLQTDIYYSDDIYDYQIVNQIDALSGSDDFIPGNKILVINGFTPGQKISFNVDASNANFAGNKIEMQFIRLDMLFKLLVKLAINSFLNTDIQTLISGQGELGKCFTYAGKTNSSSGGSLEVKPYFNLLVGRFVATNPFSGYGDTCIITDYQPNTENPEQGGTFTLGGF